MPPTTARRPAGQRARRERVLAAHLAGLPPERWDLLKKLINLAEVAEKLEERLQISRTILEIIYPQPTVARPVRVDSNPEQRTKLLAYRKKVGEAIRLRRFEAKLSQVRLAELAGLPQTYISKLELGKHTATKVTIEKVACALKVRPCDLDPGFPDGQEPGGT